MKFFNLTSHTLSDEQTATLKDYEIINLPDDLQNVFSQVGIESNDDLIAAGQIIEFLKENSNKGDKLLVQGEMGTVFLIVSWALKNGLAPYHATSVRESKEEVLPDGSTRKVNVFRHHIFRCYKDGSSLY